jgi:prepilin-type N-terminal cleavage/methylation domain-containing protein
MTVHKAKKNIHESGFTLVEIMIAILILGLVLSTVYAAYSSTMRIVHDLEYQNNL